MSYYFLGVQQTERGMKYEVLDTLDASIDQLTENELNKAQSMSLNIQRLYGSDLGVNILHRAERVPDTSLRVLFKLENGKVLVSFFDERGFFRFDGITSELEFNYLDTARVRIGVYLINSEVYINIRIRVRGEGIQYMFLRLFTETRAFQQVFRTHRISSSSCLEGKARANKYEEDAMVKRYLDSLEERSSIFKGTYSSVATGLLEDYFGR